MIKFNETQHFEQKWLKWSVLLMPIIIVSIHIADLQSIASNFQKNAPITVLEKQIINTIGMAFLISILTGVFLFKLAKLTTWVQHEELYIKFSPFHSKPRIYKLSEIKSAEAITYRPILDFGGWGLKYSHKGKIYNAHGNKAVEIHFKWGKKLFVGSQKAEELASILQAHVKRSQ